MAKFGANVLYDAVGLVTTTNTCSCKVGYATKAMTVFQVSLYHEFWSIELLTFKLGT